MHHAIWTILLVLAVLTSAQCTWTSTADYGLDPSETIRINLQSEPPELDWIKCNDTLSGTVLDNIMEGLMGINLNDPHLPTYPLLAKELTVSPDGKTWTITLREGIQWTDGIALKAKHVIDAWEYLLNPKTISPHVHFLFAVKNAEAYAKGKLTDFSQVGIKATEQGQIVVQLEKPVSYFPYILTFHALYPIRKDIIEKYGNKWTQPENIQTLGVYKIKLWDHDKAMVLEANDLYWGEKAKTRYILGYMINEYSSAVSLFQAGRLDFQETIPLIELQRLSQVPGFHQGSLLGSYYYAFNVRKAPMNEVKVRQAIAHGIDRKQVTDLLNGGMTPQESWLPKGMMGSADGIGMKFDLALANKLLDEAGYKNRAKFPKLTIGINTNDNHQRMAENIQFQLRKNLHIETEIQNQEWKVYLNTLKTDPPHIFRLGWIAEIPDPDSFFSIMLSSSPSNSPGWKNTAYDELVAEAATVSEPLRRREVYAKAEKLLVEEETPMVPIYSYAYSMLVSPRLRNFPFNSMLNWQFKGVSIAPKQ